MLWRERHVTLEQASSPLFKQNKLLVNRSSVIFDYDNNHKNSFSRIKLILLSDELKSMNELTENSRNNFKLPGVNMPIINSATAEVFKLSSWVKQQGSAR